MGPTCSVLFEAELTDRLKGSICRDLASLGSLGERGASELEVEIDDATLLGGDRQTTRRSVLVIIESPPSEYEEDELSRFESAVGFRPQTSLTLALDSNTAEGHRLLGQAAFYFGEKHSGVIDFNGALLPPRLPLRFSFETTPWDEISGRFRAMVEDLPGELWEFPYVTTNGVPWVSHVGTPDFLRAWLASPGFHMVK